MIDGYPYAALHDAAGNMLLPLTVDGPEVDPFTVSKLDLGSTDTREDVSDTPGADGTDDYTSFAGARGVSIELTAHGNAEAPPYIWLDRLGRYCQPSTRCYLHVKAVDWDKPRRILIRGASEPGDLTDPEPDVQFQWRAPQGWLEDIEETVVELKPIDSAEPGLAEPWSDPISIPAGFAGGVAPFVVPGKKDTWPTYDLYDCTMPQLVDALNQERQFTFLPGFVVPAGHFIRLQPQGPNGPLVAFDGDPAQNQYSQLDFSVSSWWPLSPGENQLTFTAATLGATCRGLVRFRPRY